MIIINEANITMPYEELHGHRAEGIDDKGRFYGKCVYLVEWESRIDFMTQAGGSTEMSDGVLTFNRPHRYPDNQAAFAEPQSLSVTPFGKVTSNEGDRSLDYGHAFVAVTYREPEEGSIWGGEEEVEDEEVLLVTESFEPVSEYITIPTSLLSAWNRLYWDIAHKNPLEEQPGFLLHTLEWVYTKHMNPSINSSLLEMGGKTNNAEVLSRSLGKTFAANTLLARAPKITRDTMSTGRQTKKLELRFVYRPQTWNKLPRVLSGAIAWASVYDQDGVAVKLYEEMDYTVIRG